MKNSPLQVQSLWGGQRPPGAAFGVGIPSWPLPPRRVNLRVFRHPLHLFSDKGCEFVIERPKIVAIYLRPRRARWWWIIIAAWWLIIAEAWVAPTWQAFSDRTPWFMVFLHLTLASSTAESSQLTLECSRLAPFPFR